MQQELIEDALYDALLAAALFARNPTRFGGIKIAASAGPVRDRYLDFLKYCLGPEFLSRKLPLNIADDRLFGGLDLSATLQAGRPIFNRGLLAEVNGGLLIVPMAERLSRGLAARIAAVMDRRRVCVQREGFATESAADFGIVLLDERVADDEQVPAELVDRITFQVDLEGFSYRSLEDAIGLFEVGLRDDGMPVQADPSELDDGIIHALCTTAMALGVDSLRALSAAKRVSEQSALWFSRLTVTPEDAAIAARLVLAPRATRCPVEPEETSSEPQPPADCAPSDNDRTQTEQDPVNDKSDPALDEPTSLENLNDLDEVVLGAAKAAIPAGLLSQLLSGQTLRGRGSGSGKSGVQQKGGLRGRPLGVRSGLPSGRARLSVIDTLRAAAPWQKLRAGPTRYPLSRVKITADDFRIQRFKARTETTTIFAVDASGSSALHRLAEAKGAVELLLADCYVRRDQVAVIAFRGKRAEVILPPTRSLVRAKRSLSGLPGGGGTPLALAIDACLQLAHSIARRGETPLIVMLTDGKANVGRDGEPGRERAQLDAVRAAQQVAMCGFTAMVIDTSPQPSEAAQKIATEMHARYLPLPYAGAAEVSRFVKAMA